MRNSWQYAVQAAIDESDPNQLELKIQQAEVAIFQRIDHSHQRITEKSKRFSKQLERYAN
jgi:hypothetical protein